MNKILLLFFVLIFASQLAFAAETASHLDTTWEGVIFVEFDKEVFEAGEEITGKLTLRNDMGTPMIGAKVVMHIATGEFSYPSQFNVESNIVHEETIGENIWILPADEKEITFSLPGQSGGDYRLDIYSWVMKSTFVGASSIFMSPQSTSFTVSGEEKERAIIHRELSSMRGIIGPVGFPVEAGETFDGTIYLVNDTSVAKKGMKITLSICEWASAFCESVEEVVYDVPDIAAGGSQNMSVELTAPDMPSAYAINMVLSSGDQIESIYKNRVIVTGGTSKIRKVFFDGLKEGVYSITVLFAGSPDHFTYPDFENFNVEVELYKSGNMIEDYSSNVEKIASNETLLEKFNLEATDFDRACARITKGGVTYEEECFPVEIEKIQEAYDIAHPKPAKVNWSYSEEQEILSFDIEKEKDELDLRVLIITTDSTVYEQEIKGGKTFSDNIYLPKDNYTMLVDDFTIGQQFSYDLFFNLAEKADDEIIGYEPNLLPEERPCIGIVCGAGESCGGESYTSREGSCCVTSCIPSLSTSGEEELIIPVIMWVAIILLALAIFIGNKAFRRMKK